jgi:hypothetical protein
VRRILHTHTSAHPTNATLRCSAATQITDKSKCAKGANTQPEQIHLALAGRSTAGVSNGMSATWYTGTLPNVTSLQYGEHASALDQTVKGSTKQYIEDYGFHHSATMSGLKVGTRYYYRVGDDAYGWSAILDFKTAPADKHTPFAVSIFGDMGWLDSDQRPMDIKVSPLVAHWSAVYTRQTMENQKNNGEIDFVWHLGDIGYVRRGRNGIPPSCERRSLYCIEEEWNRGPTEVLDSTVMHT